MENLNTWELLISLKNLGMKNQASKCLGKAKTNTHFFLIISIKEFQKKNGEKVVVLRIKHR